MTRRDEVPEGIPPKLWFHFSDIWSRQDELMESILTILKRQLEVLERLAGVTPPIVPKIVERPVIPTPLEVEFSIKAVERLAARLIQLPNRLDNIEIETSNKSWTSLRKAGKITPDVALGFWIESVGGGFSYKIVRQSHEFKPKTAPLK